MRCARISAYVGFLCFAFALPSHAVGPIAIPKEGDGYQITRADSSQAAPSGFEGRTETSTQSAIGNTPETAGKRIVGRFTLGNQVRTCPQADGTAEGEGVFSISVDSTDAQANGTSAIHIEMRASAKYKGQVGDDGFLQGPVNAHIHYTYNESGSFRDKSGAIANPAASHTEQDITLPITVSKAALDLPKFGAFGGGDPTKGHYSDALGAALPLAFWAGVFYSVAETKWIQGECVEVVFNPPSNTVQPALGSQTTVSVEIKTKSGEGVRAHLQNVRSRAGGVVEPSSGSSDVGSPAKFTYTAPNEKAASGGFAVSAISRAGAAEGDWDAGLGSGWSGQITCIRESKGDEGQNDLQSWSNYEAMRINIKVKNGVGMATGYGEVKSTAINKRRALRSGATVLLDDTRSSVEGAVIGSSQATVEVSVNNANGTYSIKPTFLPPFIIGKQHWVTCTPDGCRESDSPLPLDPGLPGEINGKSADANHLQGSRTDVKSNLGRTRTGTQSWTLTWDLARQGSATSR